MELGQAVIAAANLPKNFQFLYPLEASIKEKIEAIARYYGADGVDYSPEAEAKVALYTRLGFDKLPICMAKTHLSFTADAEIKGAPVRFPHPHPRPARLGRRRLHLSAGRQHAHHARPAHPARCSSMSIWIWRLGFLSERTFPGPIGASLPRQ